MRSAIRAALCSLLVLWTVTVLAGPSPAAPVLLVTSGQNGTAMDEATAAIRNAITAALASTEVVSIDWREFSDEAAANRRVIVTVGTQAAQAVAERPSRQTVLHTLLPRESYMRLPGPRAGGRSSAIFLDQPASRQAALIAEALPQWPRVALIASPRSEALATEIAASGVSALRFTIETIATERELYPALQRSLAQPAVLLALPDSSIFNSHTIQNVLLTAYRNRSPVIGFSPAYVRAGALLALYSTPTQLGEQAAEAVRLVLDGGALPPPQYPRRFEVGINQNVARSLGIMLDPAEQLAARITRREIRP